jgi:hypothetical protein
LNDWQKTKREEIIRGIYAHFSSQIKKDPIEALCTIEQELENQEICIGNDWLGRGIVGDTVMSATIEGLEIVRSDCLAILKVTNRDSSNKTTA